MRALLDANVLIALLDLDHMFHNAAHAWIDQHMSDGWASCPLTENAFVRIMSNPGYSGVQLFSVSDRIDQISRFATRTNHEFWPDGISLLDSNLFDIDRILGPRQLTDVYLLALAAHYNGRLVTFDHGISASAVRRATPENLCVI